MKKRSEGSKGRCEHGDTTLMIWKFGLLMYVERDTLDDSLGDILFGFVTVIGCLKILGIAI